jgi:hypothetical protein
MQQESRIEEESWVTQTGLTGYTTQIGLLRTAGVTGTAARVSRQIGLLGSAGVTERATRT